MSDPFDRPARPWDLFNRELGRVEPVIAEERMGICRECPMLNAIGQCEECNCIMHLKVKLPNASCPLGKWQQVRVTQSEPLKIVVTIDGEVVDVLHADERMAAIFMSSPQFVGVPYSTEVKIGERFANDSGLSAREG